MKNCCPKNRHSAKNLNELTKILKVIAEPNRLRILCFLSSGTKCVCEIERNLSLSQNLVSHHLKVLREANLISFTKQAQWKHYALNQKVIDKFQLKPIYDLCCTLHES